MACGSCCSSMSRAAPSTRSIFWIGSAFTRSAAAALLTAQGRTWLGSLPVGHRLHPRVRGRRAGCRALPQDRSPERRRAGDADGRRLRQGLWLVTEERLVLPCGSIGGEPEGLGGGKTVIPFR